jgi:eukaryotic-like serine/threonine-protein kinase
LFQMLTGKLPFTGDSPVAMALSHVREEVPSVHQLAPDVPPPLAEVVAIATAKDPQNRYADAAQMGAALRTALAAPHTASATDLPAAAEATDLPAVPDQAAMPNLPAGAAPNLPAAAEAPGLRRRSAAAPRALLVAAAGLLLVGTLVAGWLAISGEPSTDRAEREPALAEPPQPQVTVTMQPPPAPANSPTALRQTISETLSPRRTNSPTPSPSPSSRRTVRGPVIPANAIGSDVQALQESLKRRGYEVKKVDIASAEPKDSVVATIPRPGVPLTAGQTVIVIASNGDAPKEPSNYVVPDGIIGSQASEAERLLKESGVEVKKVAITSPRPNDTIVATYPTAGKTAQAGTVVLAVSTGG